jgi:hypothetical protein
MPRTGSWAADRDSLIWYMVSSSQKSRPQLRQLTLPLTAPSLLPQVGSVHTSKGVGFCQWERVIRSSGSRTASGALGLEATWSGFDSLDSNASIPRKV